MKDPNRVVERVSRLLSTSLLAVDEALTILENEEDKEVFDAANEECERIFSMHEARLEELIVMMETRK